MEKVLLSLSMISVLSVTAQTLSEPKAEWANLLTGVQGADQVQSISARGTNEVYWLATNGTTSKDRQVDYGDVKLYDGAMYDGTSKNYNLTLLKTDASGKEQWCVYSEWGDFTSGNEGGVTTNSKGDVIFATTVRHTEGYLDKPITIVDAKGNKTEIEWAVEKRWKQLIVGSVSSDGELQWVKVYGVDNGKAAAASTDFTADAIQCSGIAADNEDNIYICGRHYAAMTFPKADNSDVTIEAKNVSTWNGNIQTAAGCMYIVKLDKDGYFLKNLAESGDEIVQSQISQLEVNDGKIYATGLVKGYEGKSISISGKSIDTTDWYSPIVACLDTDLNAQWVVCYPGSDFEGASTYQLMHITLTEDAIYLTGGFNGEFANPANAAESVKTITKNTREGYLVKLNRENGSWIKGVTSNSSFGDTKLLIYTGSLVPASEPGKVYVYGYDMTGSKSVYLRCYDSATLEADKDHSWTLVTTTGMPSCAAMAYEPETSSLYISARSNKAMTPLGGEESAAITGYTELLIGFKLPTGFASGISAIAAEGETPLMLACSKGMIFAGNVSDKAQILTVYDLSGRCVVNKEVAPGEQLNINLESGLYIVNGRKVML